jgi:hypothetical protein
MACGAIFFGVLGGVGLAMFPFGWEQYRAGRLPLAVAFWVIGVFGLPLLFFAAFTIFAGIRDAIAPPSIRVTPDSLMLPAILRQYNCKSEKEDEYGECKTTEPVQAHPEVIPFSAIRFVRRDRSCSPIEHKLLIVHDLGQQILEIEQSLMNRHEFNELEAVLRSAVPPAFSPTPPAT